MLAQRLAGMLEISETTLRNVKRLASELKPALLEEEGLEAAMEWHLQQFVARSGLKWRFSFELQRKIEGQLRTAMFRIFQEAVANATRHAKATRLDVRIDQSPRRLRVLIRDDGCGIDREAAANPESLGLIGMRERAEAFGGRMRVCGARGKGTAVVACFPVAEKRNARKAMTYRIKRQNKEEGK